MLRRRLATVALRQRRIAPATTRNYATAKEEEDPQLEGYPKLPFRSRQYLSPYGWQDPLERRNFGEPVHEKHELLSMWGPDIPPVAPHIALYRLTLVALGFVGFGYYVKNVLTPEQPAVRREYPFSGLVTELGGLEQNKAREETTLEEE